MRRCLHSCIFSWLLIASCHAGELPRTEREAKPIELTVKPILREASELALKQDEDQTYWTERVLLKVGELQGRVGDFDGALQSIRGSGYLYGRTAGLAHLAEAIARHGNRERAFQVLKLEGSDGSWEDGVHLAWLDYLIESGDRDRAAHEIEQLKSKRFRVDGLRKIAVAYAKSGEVPRSAEYFSRTVNAATGLRDDFGRA